MNKITTILKFSALGALLSGCSLFHDSYYYGGDYGPIWPFEDVLYGGDYGGPYHGGHHYHHGGHRHSVMRHSGHQEARHGGHH